MMAWLALELDVTRAWKRGSPAQRRCASALHHEQRALDRISHVLISIVLVHGTWARGSRWPVLEAEIRRAFAAEEVTIQYLNWSGRNSVSARLSAAEALVQLLEDDIRERPDARRFIVAHSHGGTVALLGLRQTILRGAMTGVICLSTPFLLVRPRRFSELGT